VIDVKLGGRLFNVVNMDRRTVLLDQHFQRLVVECGIDKILPGEAETDETYVARLHLQIIRSGLACELLGGYLLPIGKTERDWTPALGKKTADAIGICDTEEERQQIDQLLTECALGFFQQRLALLMSFANSLNREPGQQRGRRKSPASPGRKWFGLWRTRTSTNASA